MSKKILIVEARFYEDMADALAEGAIAALEEAGCSYERVSVPGVLEVPVAIKYAAETGAYDGYVALGVVIRGETSHYDHICNEVSRAIMDMTVTHGFPIGFGVLTCENMAQAEVRADPARKNKGAEAAKTIVRMIDVRAHFLGRDDVR